MWPLTKTRRQGNKTVGSVFTRKGRVTGKASKGGARWKRSKKKKTEENGSLYLNKKKNKKEDGKQKEKHLVEGVSRWVRKKKKSNTEEKLVDVMEGAFHEEIWLHIGIVHIFVHCQQLCKREKRRRFPLMSFLPSSFTHSPFTHFFSLSFIYRNRSVSLSWS